jgi:beta-galactosidase
MKSRPSSRGADHGRRDALKSIAAIAALPLVPDLGSAAPPQTASDARDRSFDGGWRFLRGEAEGAERPDFDDSAWRLLDLPHDWSIEDLTPRLESTGEADLREPHALPMRVGPFDAVESEGGQSTGFVVGGTGWYRKRFPGSVVPAGQRAEIRFDGVYMDADVWLNGELLGNHPYGYTGFMLDATPHLRRDGENVLAVRVRNAGKNSRWYSGSGIYRHVWLTVTGEVRIPTWGVGVTTPKVAADSATARVVTTIENHSSSSRKVGVRARVLDPSGAEPGTKSAEV